MQASGLGPDILPYWLVAGTLTLLGAIWGSFVAALCQRWPAGDSILRGRSRCDHCGETLRAHELVPLFSYLLQRGRCRHCGRAIGRDSLVIEASCAAIGLLCASLLTPSAAFASAALCWLLLPIALLDWRHYWLADRLLLLLGCGGLAVGGMIAAEPSLWDRMVGGLGGYAGLQLLRLGYRQFRGIEAMGAGDPKMLGAIGLWTGWQPLPLIMVAASMMGIAHYLMRSRNGTKDDVRFPLGSYMAAGTILWLFALEFPGAGAG